MELRPVLEWHEVIAGNLQKEGDASGMPKLWRYLQSRVSGRDTVVTFSAWNHDPASIAERIWRLSLYLGVTPKVFIYAYSWGCMTAINVCRALRRRGLKAGIKLVFSDPVYRHWYKLGWWRSLVNWFSIKVPDNVDEAWYYVQRNPLLLFNGRVHVNPRGHRLHAEDPQATTIHGPRVMAESHQYMDDLTDFHWACIDVAREVEPWA